MNRSMFIDAVGMVDADIVEAYVLKDMALRSRKRSKTKRYLVTLLAAAISMLLVVALLVTSLPLVYITNREAIDSAVSETIDRVIFPLDDEDADIKQEDLLINWVDWPVTEQIFNAFGAGTEDSIIDQMMQNSSGTVQSFGELLDKLFDYYEKYKEDIDSPTEKESETESESQEAIMLELDGCTYRKGVGQDYWMLYSVDKVKDGVLTIPEAIEGLPVTKIRQEAAKERSTLRELILPDSITHIGEKAFWGCRNLSSITWSQNLEEIGEYAFAYCQSLTRVELPDSLTKLGSYAFYECSNEAGGKGIEYVSLPDGLTEVPQYCFAMNPFLNFVVIPDSVTQIMTQAFYQCSALGSVDLPKNLESLGPQAFAETGLVVLDIPEGTTLISSACFENCTQLTAAQLPQSVTEIRESAFSGCGNLHGIELPQGLTNLGKSAFSGTALTEIIIPGSVEVISLRAFEECHALESVILAEGTTTIGQHSFAECENLQIVGLPSTLTEIQSNAFEGCKLLTAISLPEGLVEVGSSAFSGTSINKIELPSTLTALRAQSFENVQYVTMNVTAPQWFCGIYREPLGRVFGSGAIVKLADGEYFADVTQEMNYLPIKSGEYQGLYELTSLEMTRYYDTINVAAYYYYDKVIGLKKAFTGAYSVKNVYLPNTIEYVGVGEFMGCTSLENIVLSNSLRELPEQCFMNCKSLQTITIPESVQSIGSQAFTGCEKLDTIRYRGTSQQWHALAIAEDALMAGVTVICDDGEVITIH